MSAAPDDARLATRLGLLFFVLVTASVHARAFFGVDFTDDAYYAALPWSFIHGHVPLVDGWAVQQFAAVLTWPAFALRVAWSGGSDGLILFQRHLHLAAALAAALCVRHGVARLFDPRLAWPVAAVVVAYVPFHIQALSYNTIAELALVAGSFTLALHVQAPADRARLPAGTLLCALATFAYPPMALPSALALGLAVRASFASEGRAAGWRAAGTAVGIMAVVAVATLVWIAAAGGVDAYAGLATLDAALSAQGGGLRKLSALGSELAGEASFGVALLLWLNALVWLCMGERSARLTGIGVVALGLGCFVAQALFVGATEPFSSVPFFLSGLALVSPLLAHEAVQQQSKSTRRALDQIVWPSLLAACVIAWASANGLRNASLGALPAALVALACSAWLIDRRMQGHPLRGWVALGLVILFVGFQLSQLWSVSYRNGPVSGLTERVESGPWAGIRTTPERKQLLGQLGEDLARENAGAETIMVFDYLPGAYLLAPLRPMTVSLWTFPDYCCQGTRAARLVYAGPFTDARARPDVIVENHCLFVGAVVVPLRPPPGWPTDPLRTQLMKAPYRVVAQQPCYTIHRLGAG